MIGYVHYKSWIETYTGLFPDEIMERITLERSAKLEKEHPENTYVAITLLNNIVKSSIKTSSFFVITYNLHEVLLNNVYDL